MIYDYLCRPQVTPSWMPWFKQPPIEPAPVLLTPEYVWVAQWTSADEHGLLGIYTSKAAGEAALETRKALGYLEDTWLSKVKLNEAIAD